MKHEYEFGRGCDKFVSGPLMSLFQIC